MNRILIIDGNSLINRAFFAVPGLANKEGVPTNALHGFLQMLQKLQNDYEPTHITVAFDMKAPTFRHQSYAAYKGTRKGMPEELRVQMPIIKEYLDYAGIHRLELEGFEADDLIGTVARIGSERGLEVFIATGDRDALQLVGNGVRVIYHGSKGNRLYGIDEVVAEFGVTPDRIPDHKGLTGDVSDNIPGVPGIGKVTASKLLQKHGTVEGLLLNIENVAPPRIKALIQEYADSAVMSKRLAAIETYVPIELDIDELMPGGTDRQGLIAFYKRYGLTVMLGRLQSEFTETEAVSGWVPPTSEALRQWCEKAKMSSTIVIHAFGETENVRRNRCRCLLMQIPEALTAIIPEEYLVSEASVIKEILENPAITIAGHNIKKDILILRNYGIFIDAPGFDTMVAAYLLEPQQKSPELDVLSLEYLNKPLRDFDKLKNAGSKDNLLEESISSEIRTVGPALAETIRELATVLGEALESAGLSDLFNTIEMPLVAVLADMEYEGFAVDREGLRLIGEELEKKLALLTSSIYEMAGENFNINSPKQLGVILFEKLGLPAGKKTKTGYSTSQDVLDKLRYENPIVEMILEYRTYSKLKSTYVDGLFAVINPDTGRVHSSLNQTIAVTGRLSSTEPNLQNIPMRIEEGRRIRKVFIPREAGRVLVDADYSQIELRVLAHMSGDPGMVQAFTDDQDIHTATASKVFGIPADEITPQERSRAKEVNFGIVYGMSDFGLSENLGITRKMAQTYIEQYFEKYEGVKRFMDATVEKCRETGYVNTLFHRRRFVPEINASNFNLRSFGERMAMNTPIQGTAADIIKLAMVRVYKELRAHNLKSRLILQVHDELIIDAAEEEKVLVEKLLRRAMEDAAELLVPLKVDLKSGYTWYDTK